MIDLALASLVATGVSKLVEATPGWTVQRVRTQRQPDLVVTSPGGETYVVEVKVGDERPRFAEVAQVENNASMINAQLGSRAVHPILVTDQPVTDSVTSAARDAGVGIVSAEGSADDIAAAVASRILEDLPDR